MLDQTIVAREKAALEARDRESAWGDALARTEEELAALRELCER